MVEECWKPYCCRSRGVRSAWSFASIALAATMIASGHAGGQTSSGAAANVPIASFVSVPTGSLNMARIDHTATLLASGKVLVVGGTYDGSAELYDPSFGTWRITGSLDAMRTGFTATLLPSGKVLVVGGEPLTGNHPNAELYDPIAETWSPTGKMSFSRSQHSATLLPSGKVLVVGGYSQASLGSAELYDPATNSWNDTSPPIYATYAHRATLLHDGKVLIAGGARNATPASESERIDVPSFTAVVFDPVQQTWQRTGDPGFGRLWNSMTTLTDGVVLVAGGYGGIAPYGGIGPDGGPDTLASTEIYDPNTDKWSLAEDLPDQSRAAHTATALSDGSILVAGGEFRTLTYFDTGANEVAGLVDQIDLFDAKTRLWRQAGTLSHGRSHHTATLLQDGRILIAGGVGGDSASAELIASREFAPGAGSPTSIGAGHTGLWYNAAQPGHGFMVEVLPGTPLQMLASWFVYGPQGGQAWIVGLGPVSGNQAVLKGTQAVGPGGRFPPNFNPAAISEQPWGTLTFTFSDCNHGHVDWISSIAGYSSGGMDLTRLTLPAGLACAQ